MDDFDIQHDGRAIPVTLSSSARRIRCSMRVTEDGVAVRTSPFHSHADVRSFLAKNRGWIIRNYAKIKSKRDSIPILADGAYASFRGDDYLIEPSLDGNCGFIDGVFKYAISANRSTMDMIRSGLMEAYVVAAVHDLESLRDKWSGSFSHSVTEFRLKEMRSRWGSCSYNGAISINWRLIMASPEVFEYVFIHEMCHLKHRGHGKGFWRDVHAFLPSASCHRAELRRDNYKLMNSPFKSSSPRTLAVVPGATVIST